MISNAMLSPTTVLGRAFTLVLMVVVAACGASVTRVVSVPGYAPEEISMSPDEGALVDRLIANEPTDEGSRCGYWKLKLSQVPPSKKNVVEYVQKEGGGTCAAQPGTGYHEAPKANVETPESLKAKLLGKKLSETGPFAGSVTVEKNGGQFTEIVVKLTMNGRPIKTPFALRTMPDWQSYNNAQIQYLIASTDETGATRISVEYAKSKIFGWYKHEGNGSRCPTFGLVVAGQWIDIDRALIPLYVSWAASDWKAKVVSGQVSADENQNEETKSGRCKPANAQVLQEAAVGLKGLFDAMSTGGDVLRVENSRIVVATEKGTPVETAPMGGEIHVFAIGFDPVSLNVQNSGYPVATKSPYEIPVRSSTQGHTDSRVMQVNWSDALPVKVLGNGCTLVVVVHKL